MATAQAGDGFGRGMGRDAWESYPGWHWEACGTGNRAEERMWLGQEVGR